MPETITLERLNGELGRMSTAVRGKVLVLAVGAGGLELATEAKKRVPRKTSTLMRSIVSKPGKSSGNRAEQKVGPTVAYGEYVERGTKAHEIRPKRGKVLVFDAGGGRVFTTSVSHPGTQAQPYMEPALKAKSKQIGEIVTGVIWGAVQKAAR